MNWMQTRSGKALDFNDPRPEAIDLEDIAWSLAHQARYNGHVGHYSVARHSVLVRELLLGQGNADLATRGLLHDAAEAYVGDIVGPLKRMLGDAVKRIEVGIDSAICAHFGLLDISAYKQHWVKRTDLTMLATEAAVFFPEDERPASWGALPPVRADYLDRIVTATPAEDYELFMSAAREAGLA